MGADGSRGREVEEGCGGRRRGRGGEGDGGGGEGEGKKGRCGDDV